MAPQPERGDRIAVGGHSLPVKRAIIAANTSGNSEVVAAATGKKIRILAYNYMGDDVVDVKFQSNTTDVSGVGYISQAGVGKVASSNQYGWFETNAGEPLNINLSAVVNVGGELSYIEVPS